MRLSQTLTALAVATTLASSVASAQPSPDPGLLREIMAIRAIDHHAHPMLSVSPGEKDPEASLNDDIPQEALPVKLRTDYVRYVAAWKAYHKALVAAGVYVSGAPLKDMATATMVRLRDGRRRVQDGPFAEAKEQLGGFAILDVASIDAALEWAARCPTAASGAVELRPIDVDFFANFVDG